jgi:NADPH:quinone reductase-like Zn-dependent oxidoreductase
MRAIVLEEFDGPDSPVIKEIPEPEPRAGHVVIQVKAFGINHAEMHMRRGEWAEAAPVSGIECVGLVKSCPGGEFPAGAKVAALMRGSAARSTAAMPNISSSLAYRPPSSPAFASATCQFRSPNTLGRR